MDFKRFVSYIYRYDGAQKLENSGFAKVELNRDILKIRIHVRTSGDPQESGQVYLFVREGEKIYGILLGEGRIKNRKMECDFKVNGNNIMDQGVSFSDIGGILLKTGSGLFYASSWDDSPIDTNQFSIYKGPGEQNGTSQRQEEQSLEEPVAENETAVVQEEQQNESQESSEESPLQEQEMVQQEESESPAELTDNKEDENEDYDAKQSSEPASEAMNETDSQIQQQEHLQEEMQEELKWNRLTQCCSSVRPFKYQDSGKFIRIEPKELWYLPKKEWVLGSNSFLLHGYYSYRYLILGKYDEEHYILGVPGRFYRQEQEMAKMFGFEQFRPVVRNNGMQGQFGYWCKELVCDNNEYCS